MSEPATICKQCKRIVYLSHVDAQGLCCFCEPTPAEADLKEAPASWPLSKGARP